MAIAFLKQISLAASLHSEFSFGPCNMLLQITALTSLLTVTVAVPPPGYQAQQQHHKSGQQTEPKYNYSYKIVGEKGSQEKQEQREGIYALGRYYVQGVGSRQTVEYLADDWGFHPFIEYSNVGPHSKSSTQIAFGEEAVKALQNSQKNPVVQQINPQHSIAYQTQHPTSLNHAKGYGSYQEALQSGNSNNNKQQQKLFAKPYAQQSHNKNRVYHGNQQQVAKQQVTTATNYYNTPQHLIQEQQVFGKTRGGKSYLPHQQNIAPTSPVVPTVNYHSNQASVQQQLNYLGHVINHQGNQDNLNYHGNSNLQQVNNGHVVSTVATVNYLGNNQEHGNKQINQMKINYHASSNLQQVNGGQAAVNYMGNNKEQVTGNKQANQKKVNPHGNQVNNAHGVVNYLGNNQGANKLQISDNVNYFSNQVNSLQQQLNDAQVFSTANYLDGNQKSANQDVVLSTVATVNYANDAQKLSNQEQVFSTVATILENANYQQQQGVNTNNVQKQQSNAQVKGFVEFKQQKSQVAEQLVPSSGQDKLASNLNANHAVVIQQPLLQEQVLIKGNYYEQPQALIQEQVLIGAYEKNHEVKPLNYLDYSRPGDKLTTAYQDQQTQLLNTLAYLQTQTPNVVYAGGHQDNVFLIPAQNYLYTPAPINNILNNQQDLSTLSNVEATTAGRIENYENAYPNHALYGTKINAKLQLQQKPVAASRGNKLVESTRNFVTGQDVLNINSVLQVNSTESSKVTEKYVEGSLTKDPIVVEDLEENGVSTKEAMATVTEATLVITPRPVSKDFLAPINAGVQLQSFKNEAEKSNNVVIEIQKSVPYYLGKYEYEEAASSDVKAEAQGNLELGKSLIDYGLNALPTPEALVQLEPSKLNDLSSSSSDGSEKQIVMEQNKYKVVEQKQLFDYQKQQRSDGEEVSVTENVVDSGNALLSAGGLAFNFLVPSPSPVPLPHLYQLPQASYVNPINLLANVPGAGSNVLYSYAPNYRAPCDHQTHYHTIPQQHHHKPSLSGYKPTFAQKPRNARQSFKQNVRLEYGFMPPLIPSTEIDENGKPIEKSDD